MKSILDVREHKLKDVWDVSKLPYEQRALPIGDWAMESEETGETVALVERKTLADLHASLRDGRWEEQKARIQANRGTALVVYVIEDDGRARLDESTGWKLSCMLGCQIRDRIHVIQTKSVRETFQALCKIWTKLQDGSWTPESESFVAPSRALRKGDNVTPAVVWRSQLACVPRVSMSIADKIAEAYPNLWEFQRRATEQGLASLRISDKRKLGPVLAKAIASAFLESALPRVPEEAGSEPEPSPTEESHIARLHLE